MPKFLALIDGVCKITNKIKEMTIKYFNAPTIYPPAIDAIDSLESLMLSINLPVVDIAHHTIASIAINAINLRVVYELFCTKLLCINLATLPAKCEAVNIPPTIPAVEKNSFVNPAITPFSARNRIIIVIIISAVVNPIKLFTLY